MYARLVLRLLYVPESVCYPHFSHVPNYVIMLLCHERTRTFAGPIGQGSLVLCCLDGKKVVGSNNTSVLTSSGH